MKLTMELSEKHVEVLQMALDTFARILIGQLSSVAVLLRNEIILQRPNKFSESSQQKTSIYDLMYATEKLKSSVFPEGEESLTAEFSSEKAKVSFDLLMALKEGLLPLPEHLKLRTDPISSEEKPVFLKESE